MAGSNHLSCQFLVHKPAKEGITVSSDLIYLDLSIGLICVLLKGYFSSNLCHSAVNQRKVSLHFTVHCVIHCKLTVDWWKKTQMQSGIILSGFSLKADS